MAIHDSDDAPKLRLYVTDDLAQAAGIRLGADQAHYVQHVMRRRAGDDVGLFNGRDGEWKARIDGFGKGWCSVVPERQIAPQVNEPDLWYLFAPVKHARLDYMMEKATELGVSRICPVLTRRTAVSRIKRERLQANAVEAAEQCGRLSVPPVDEECSLERMLESWPADRRLIFCDEGGGVEPLGKLLRAAEGAPRTPWALLIGPEGGFDAHEREMLKRQSFVTPVSLGPRILRADTAAVAALSLWQMVLGDWS